MTTAKEGSAAGKAAQQQDQVRPRRRSRSRRDRAHSGSDCGAAVTFPSSLCLEEEGWSAEGGAANLRQLIKTAI